MRASAARPTAPISSSSIHSNSSMARLELTGAGGERHGFDLAPGRARCNNATMKVMVLPVTPFQQNCSIIWDERSLKAAVVDPGGDLPEILAQLDHRSLTLEKILVTHGHLDHAAATAELAAMKEVPIEG